jgi:hypothetical protein
MVPAAALDAPPATAAADPRGCGRPSRDAELREPPFHTAKAPAPPRPPADSASPSHCDAAANSDAAAGTLHQHTPPCRAARAQVDQVDRASNADRRPPADSSIDNSALPPNTAMEPDASADPDAPANTHLPQPPQRHIVQSELSRLHWSSPGHRPTASSDTDGTTPPSCKTMELDASTSNDAAASTQQHAALRRGAGSVDSLLHITSQLEPTHHDHDATRYFLLHYSTPCPTLIQTGTTFTIVYQTDGLDQGCGMAGIFYNLSFSIAMAYIIARIPLPSDFPFPLPLPCLIHDDSTVPQVSQARAALCPCPQRLEPPHTAASPPPLLPHTHNTNTQHKPHKPPAACTSSSAPAAEPNGATARASHAHTPRIGQCD